MIRTATINDLDAIILMLGNYKHESPLDLHKHTDQTTARTILKLIFDENRGVVFLAEEGDEIIGMLITIKNFNMWDQTAICLNELAYWVEPNHRGTTAGYRLMKAYIETGNLMKQSGEIKYFTISKMINSPDLDYGRFGFNKLEETWSQ